MSNFGPPFKPIPLQAAHYITKHGQVYLQKQLSNQPALLHKANRIFKCGDQSKSAFSAVRRPGDDFAAGAQGIAGRNGDSTNRDDGAGGDDTDDGLPPIEDIPDQISRQGISTGGDRNAKATTR